MALRGKNNNGKNAAGGNAAIKNVNALVDVFVFWLSLSVLVLVPLAFSTSVHRTFSLPKYLILLAGSSALIPLVGSRALTAARGSGGRWREPFSKHTLLVLAWVATGGLSTILGAAPVASFFGSFENKMGLVTRLCFLICFLGLTLGIGRSRARLIQLLWGLLFTGFAVATYAFVQFFGRDPFLPLSVYAVDSMGAPIVRAVGTLGHSNYLGNFLLYTTPLAASFAVAYGDIARRFAVAATALSTAAIAFSGTRGAWLGLIAGGAIFIVIELPRKSGDIFDARWRPIMMRLTIGLSILAASVWLIASTTVSRSVVARARLLVSAADAGAGRTLLWRDSLRMAPFFPLVGCGPEAFRKAFLPYKSVELSRLAPNINNESSHNSYIDAAVSFGLPGLILYVAIIASTFSLLWSARRRTSNRRLRLIITGLLSSFAAVVTHNFFIFDQISTGLYFFSFVALASVVSRVAAADEKKDRDADEQEQYGPVVKKGPRQVTASNHNRTAVCALVLSAVAVLSAAWYSAAEITADKAIAEALAAGAHGNLDQVMISVDNATRNSALAGQYDFVAARAFTLCAERLKPSQSSSQLGTEGMTAGRRAAIDLAIMHAHRTLAHTLTPDSSYVLLAYLALLSEDPAKLRAYATEAVKWDPYSPNARWLMAEAYLAEGDREQAAREAQLAREIAPSSTQARSALERAQEHTETRRLKVEKAIANARVKLSKGKLTRAELVLRRAISRSPGPCPECHRLLASIYEADRLYENAIGEWQTFLAQAPDRASAEDAATRITALRQMTRRSK